MSKGFEKIVASLELCKLIPAGEFEDTALVWVYDDVVGFLCRTSGCEQIHKKEWQLQHNHPRKIAIRRECGQEIYPAPTLAELLEKLDKRDKLENKLKICPVFPGGEWSVGYAYMDVEKDFELTAAALRLWLKLKGIEVKS